jgi:hypothetical protein
MISRIQGLHDPKSLTVVTVEPTPFGLTQKAEKKAVSVTLLPTKDYPGPPAIAPLKTATTAAWGVWASLIRCAGASIWRVTLGDGRDDLLQPVATTAPNQP